MEWMRKKSSYRRQPLKVGVLFVFIIVALYMCRLWNISGGFLESNEGVTRQKNSGISADLSWNQWFQPLESILSHTQNTSAIANQSFWKDILVTQAHQQSTVMKQQGRPWTPTLIMYYHVMKTGGSTIYRLFHQMHLHTGLGSVIQHSPRLSKECCGPENPGALPQLLRWKNSTTTTNADSTRINYGNDPPLRKLVVISFREPLERVVSHYYQVKPCPDGSQGGSDRLCKDAAQRGFVDYLQHCRFSSNFQSQYVGPLHSMMSQDERQKYMTQQFTALDFIINSNQLSESLVLLSAKYHIPIPYLIPVEWDKVRTQSSAATNAITSSLKKESGDQQGGDTVLLTPAKSQSRPSSSSSAASCTTQWLDQLVPISQRIPCQASCAGLWGLQSLTEEERVAMERYNRHDIDLWEQYVLPHYQSTRRSILEAYGIGDEELMKTVALYEELQRRILRGGGM